MSNEPMVMVSDLFVDIYRNFNVSNQANKINMLTDRELYLLLVLCIDKHDEDNNTVCDNFKPYIKELSEIMSLQEDGFYIDNLENIVLLELVKETADNTIETKYIVDSNGQEMPEPYTKEEVRDIKIDLIGN